MQLFKVESVKSWIFLMFHAGSRIINFGPQSRSFFHKRVFKNGRIFRFCFVFQVILVILSNIFCSTGDSWRSYTELLFIVIKAISCHSFSLFLSLCLSLCLFRFLCLYLCLCFCLCLCPCLCLCCCLSLSLSLSLSLAIKRPRTRSTTARQVSNAHERDLVTNQNV